jgi:hypothetical protein
MYNFPDNGLPDHLRDRDDGNLGGHESHDPHDSMSAPSPYGNGAMYLEDQTDFSLPRDVAAELEERYLEEAALIINQLAEMCIERGELTYPPSPEDTLELATELFEEHFVGSGLPRLEIIDVFTAVLLEKISERHRTTVHDLAMLGDSRTVNEASTGLRLAA